MSLAFAALLLLESTVFAAADTSTTSTSTAADEDVIVIPPDDDDEQIIDLTPPEEGAPDEPPVFSAVAPRVRTSIKLETRLSVDTSFDLRGEHVGELGLGARLELDLDIARNLTAFTAPSVYWVGALSREGADHATLFLVTPEARVTWTFGPFDLRAGALVFNWGASDLIGPNDVLNPLDYRRNFVAAIDDLKIPVIAAELVTAVGPLTLRAVIEPFFTPSRYFLNGWDTALVQPRLMSGLDVDTLTLLLGRNTVDAIGDQLLLTERPGVRPIDGTFAARGTITAGDLDLSFTAVHGWEPLPQVDVNRDLVLLTSGIAQSVANRRPFQPDLAALGRLQAALQRGEILFRGAYNRRDTVGFDAVYAIDPFVLKLDTAYSFSRTSYTQDYRPVSNPWLNTVVGIEYVSGDDLQILFEAFNITIFDVPSDVRLAFFEPRAPPPSTTTSEGRRTLATPGAAGVIRWGLFEGDLRLELAGVTTITRGDLLLMPSIHVRLDDAQELTFGGTLVEGRDDGYGGAYTHNDQVFVQYVWTH